MARENLHQSAAAEFNTRLEQWFLTNFRSYGIVRPEWTKCYGYPAGTRRCLP